MNWKGQSLIRYEFVVNLIVDTTTKNGLKIEKQLDLKNYEKRIKIAEEELSKINLKAHSIYP